MAFVHVHVGVFDRLSVTFDPVCHANVAAALLAPHANVNPPLTLTFRSADSPDGEQDRAETRRRFGLFGRREFDSRPMARDKDKRRRLCHSSQLELT